MVGARTRAPGQVQGSGSVGGSLRAPGRRTGFVSEASPHRQNLTPGVRRVIPTSTSIWAHTLHPRRGVRGSSWEALCSLPQPLRPRGMTRTGLRSPGNRHSTATRCMGVLGWGLSPLPDPLIDQARTQAGEEPGKVSVTACAHPQLPGSPEFPCRSQNCPAQERENGLSPFLETTQF